MWKSMGLFSRKNYLLRYCGWLSVLNWIGTLTLSLLPKLLQRKLEHWFVLSFFLLVATWNCWISYKNGYAGLLVLHLLSLEPLAHHRNVASLSLFYKYYFGRCSSELAHLVPLPYSWRSSTCYSDRLHDFSLTIPRCYKDVYVNSFFPRTARLWNSLPIECFALTYDLNRFKSRINRHLLPVGSVS